MAPGTLHAPSVGVGRRPRAKARGRSLLLAVALLVVALLAGCSSSYDAGSTPREQLCDVLESALEIAGSSPPLAFEVMVEDAAANPTGTTDLPSELVAVALAHQANEGAYDALGEYEPAIRFTVALVELAQEQLIGASQLSPEVRESAKAVDAAIRDGACAG